MQGKCSMNGHNYNLEEIAALFESSMNSVFRRVVYMKPNHYSDEALAVGVVIKHSEGFEFEYVSSVSAYNALSCFYGSESAEQLNKIAMDNLQGSLGGSWSKIKWGHSDTTPIGQSKEISPITYQGNILETTLSYSSPHAAVVEFGAVVPHNITENYTPTASPVEKWIHALPGKVFLIGTPHSIWLRISSRNVEKGP